MTNWVHSLDLQNQGQDHQLPSRNLTNDEQTKNKSRTAQNTKRKSNAHLAAEIVQQERDAIRALKRLSMGGGSFNIDPDFQIAIESEYNTDVVNQTLEKKQRRKSSSSLSSDNDDSEATLINEDLRPYQNSNNDELPTILPKDSESPSLKAIVNNQKIIKKLDTEKLLWVPAKSHPKIAPEKFRRHVQNTLDDFKDSNNDNLNEPDEIRRIRRIKKKSSIPSLKELTDELDRLSEMAGLAATDAVTLARSLSSTSFNKQQEEQLGGVKDTVSAPSSSIDPFASVDSNGDSVDEDEPILGYGNSLRRNQFSTYSRSTRMKRNTKNDVKPESKLSSISTPDLRLGSESMSPVKETIDKENNEITSSRFHENQRGMQFGNIELRSKSSNGSLKVSTQSGSTGKKTNHSRSRHSGSIIGLEYNQASDDNQNLKLYLEPTKDTTSKSSFGSLVKSESTISLKKTEEKPSKKNDSLILNHQENVFLDTGSKANIELEPTVTPVTVKSKSKEFLNIFRKKRSASTSSSSSSSVPAAPISALKDKTIAGRSISFDEGSNASSLSSQDQTILNGNLKTSPKKEINNLPSTSTSSSSSSSLSTSTTKISPSKSKNSTFRFSKKKDMKIDTSSIPPAPLPTRSLSPSKNTSGSPPVSKPGSPQQAHFAGVVSSQEQHRIQKESLEKKLLSLSGSPSKPNAPLQFQDSAFGFPLPPLSRSTIVMLDYRFPVHVERALYRLSHLKLANPKRELRQQVLLSNFMYAYLNLVNHTLYLQQLDEDGQQGTFKDSGGDFLN